MRTRIFIAALSAAVLALPATPPSTKEQTAEFKTVEAKHYTRAEGVELSPEFADYLYAELRNELGKTKLFGQVIGEGEVVSESDAPSSVIVDGSVTEYKKGSVVKDTLIGFTAGWRSLRVETTVTRRSDKKAIATVKTRVRISPRWKENIMAREAAKQIAREIKKALKAGSEGAS